MPLQQGTRLGHYRIGGRVGGGGMGEVYRAHDENLGRDVALKVLTDRLVDSPELQERFEREARAVAALSHSNILVIHDFGREGATAYAVSELLEGETLRQRLAAPSPLPPRQAIVIARDIARGLAAAHQKRIVHRDIKPENVFLTAGGAVKILDFGLARSHDDPADSLAETLAAGAAGDLARADAALQLTTPGDLLGTVGYMSPEQVRGQVATPRSDVFALGCVLHEMLSGRPPFVRASKADALAAVLAAEAPALTGLGTTFPKSVASVLAKCLAKEPGARYEDGSQLLADLDAVCHEIEGPPPIEARSIAAWLRRPAIAIPLLLAVVAVAFGIYRWNERQARETWARRTAIPQAQRLLGENRWFEAWELAVQARAVLDNDPALEALWLEVTTPLRVTTDPAGATVSYRPYRSASPSEAWRTLGETPYRDDHFPVGAFRFRIEKASFEPVEVARSLLTGGWIEGAETQELGYLGDASYALDLELSAAGSLPQGMLAVGGGTYLSLPLPGADVFVPREVPAFLIDRTEVTNQAYREFVAAGAYQSAGQWSEPFERDGKPVSMAEAMAAFRDSTGRAGPATWLLGAARDQSESLPVSGVSWFEAAAYCRWRGMALPTLYHWARATLPSSEVWIPFTPFLVEESNFGGVGPVAVASRPAIGVSGAYDLTGNVREWVSTATGDRRYLLGGAWSDPVYFANLMNATTPWDRSPTNGFRCAKYPEGDPPAPLRAAIDPARQDFSREVKMSDEAFETAKRFYAYDHSRPLRASLDSSRQLDWGAVEEWVSIDAAYGGERLPMRLLLPAGGGVKAPFQAVVYFPASNFVFERELGTTSDLHFLVRSGRAVVEPVYDGGFQRNDGHTLERWADPASRNELVVHWAQDLGRVIDYLEQRPDVDAAKVAFAGLSLGAGVAPDLVGYEPRVRASILWSGGFWVYEDQPSIDRRIGLARRVTVPILMLAGSGDTAIPVDPNQRALFRFFGGSEQDKRMQVYEGAGHWPLPMNDVVRESVDFLDRYLGPVTSGQ